jgi:hypothetical protein
MKIIGLDHKEYSWNPTSGKNPIKTHSSYHTLARGVIRSLYKSEPLLEEVSLPGTKPTLYADFILPHHKVVIEVHGEQHYEHVPYFQPQKRDFMLGKKRDLRKIHWCELNDFTFVELPYWETESEWRTRISEA